MSDYYDREGRPIEMMEWVELMHEDYKRVAETRVGQVYVSTVWLGLNHNWGRGRPLIYETMAFGPGSWSELLCERYSTEAEALAGHERAVALARRRHHGWTKHTRDELRREKKDYLRLLDQEARGELGDGELGEMNAALLAMARMRRERPVRPVE